jgi:TM2 domain-containing membrane protein YozV
VIYCEQCLAARLGIGGVAAGPTPAGAPGIQPGVIAAGPSPATAFVLGFIPGVGAMYNGQFVKGMIHVLIFVILVAMANHEGVFAILIAAWVVYQVFDAYQTAKARREGLPLPDPFGLNDLGAKMGVPHTMGGASAAQGFVGGQVPPPPGAVPPAAGFTNPYAPYSDPRYPSMPPVPPPSCGTGYYGRRTPVGAIVLIGLGVLFLLNTLDVFHFDWIGRLWPLLIIGFGAVLFVRRSREISPPPPPPPPPGPGGVQ